MGTTNLKFLCSLSVAPIVLQIIQIQNNTNSNHLHYSHIKDYSTKKALCRCG